jgi:DHA2 family multidrug resistance protein-like MFS transporter
MHKAFSAAASIAEPQPPPRAVHPGLPMPRRLAAILSLSAGSILYALDANIANIALPTIAHALTISQSTAVLIVSTYNLALAMTLLPLAAIGDRIGHRKLFTIGFIAYVAAAAGCFFANTFVELLMARATQAVAAASLLSVAFGMIRTIYPGSVLGRGMGFNTVMSSGGAAVAPVLGGFLISAASWHWVFVAGVPLALVGLASSAALPDSELSTEPYDTWGAVLCAMTFGLLIIGFQGLGDGMSVVTVSAILAAGGCAAGLFVWHERRVSLPVLPVDLLARPKLALSVGAALLAVLASTALLLYLPFRLSALGFGAATVGAMIAPYAFAIIVAAPASGMLSDKISPHLLGLLGLAIATAGIAAFIWLPVEPSYADVAWRSAVCGVGFAMFFSPNGRIMITSAPANRLAGASSLLSTTRMFGQALGSAMLGGLLAVTALPKLPIVTATVIVAIALICAAIRIMMKDDVGEI